jgi:endonuclease-8
MAVCFAAPVVEWLRPGFLDLGPDATTDAFDAGLAVRRLADLREATIEQALLTQSAMAGVGNVIKCEALFIRRLDPFARVAALTPEALIGLVTECHHLLVRNRTGGPRIARESFDGGRLWVYGRAGKPCLVCGNDIRVRRSERLTWFCPECQQSTGALPRPGDRSAHPGT